MVSRSASSPPKPPRVMDELLWSRRALLGTGAAGAGLLATPAWARGESLRHGAGAIRTGSTRCPARSSTWRSARATDGRGAPRSMQSRSTAAFPPAHPPARRTDRPAQRHQSSRGGQLNPLARALLHVPVRRRSRRQLPGIRPHQTFTYEFPVRQSGTYWWHSHSNCRSRTAIRRRSSSTPGSDPVAADRESFFY